MQAAESASHGPKALADETQRKIREKTEKHLAAASNVASILQASSTLPTPAMSNPVPPPSLLPTHLTTILARVMHCLVVVRVRCLSLTLSLSQLCMHIA